MLIRKMSELDLKGKRILIREDLNVPVKNGVITSDLRIQAALPSLKLALDAGASVLVLSHLGRPTEGEYSDEFSLAPVAAYIAKLLKKPVPLIKNYLDGVQLSDGEIALCENVRFNMGEKKDDTALGKKYAALCDIFVMDAFGTAHRAEASTSAVAKFAPIACAGLLLTAELEALQKALAHPKPPLVAIIGGAKVSTKLTILDSLCNKVNTLIVGGGIANTFLKAAGHPVGKSLYEPDLVDEAARIMQAAHKKGVAIPLPTDVVVGKEFSDDTQAIIKKLDEVTQDDMILDIGPSTVAFYASLLQKAGTIVWNGPVGAFELAPFSRGTEAVCRAVAESPAFSIAGGGDTLAAIDAYHVADKISYLSTGGGAFLEFLEGKTLPGVAALEARGKK